MNRGAGAWVAPLLAGAILVLACDNEEECRALRALKRRYDRALAVTRARAAHADRVAGQARAAEARARRLLDQHRLEAPAKMVTEALEARIQQISGATVTYARRATATAPGPRAQGAAPAAAEDVWQVDVPGGWRDVFAASLAVRTSVPLLRVSVVRPTDGGGRIELGRLPVPRVPIRLSPRPLPPLPSTTEIPSRWGWCGAKDLRTAIEAAGSELEALRLKAEAVTVDLPTHASWDGLHRRVTHAIALEKEAARLMKALATAAVKAGVDIKALGQENDAVVLELRGGPEARGRIERALPAPLLKAVRFVPAASGELRLIAANRVARPGRRSSPRAVDSGPPAPGARKESLDAAGGQIANGSRRPVSE